MAESVCAFHLIPLLLSKADAKYYDNPTARSSAYLQSFLYQLNDDENTLKDYAIYEAFLDANYAAFTASDISHARDLLSKSVEITGISRDFDILRSYKGYIFNFSLNGSVERNMQVDFDKCEPIAAEFKELKFRNRRYYEDGYIKYEPEYKAPYEIAIHNGKMYLRHNDDGKYTYYEFKSVIRGGHLSKKEAEHMYNLLVNKFR